MVQVLFALCARPIRAQQNLPDLMIVGEAAQPRVVTRTFLASDCEVVEGCAQPGTRQLLVFNAETANIGTADLLVGSPEGNPLFEYSSCHNHYHFKGFNAYRFLDANSQLIAVGNKGAFCLEDVVQVSSNANPDRKYSCDNQGIQAGWADVYSADLPCQFIDITGVGPGNYILEIEADPNHLIPELNEDNNIAQINVSIAADCSVRPGNDNFGGAQTITTNPASITAFNHCATKQTGEPNHAGDAGGHSLWYRWAAPSTTPVRISTEGSDFDTVLAVYRGPDVAHLTLIASNDDINPGNKRSRVIFTPSTGTTYFIAVDGSSGAVGRMVLNVNPPANDDFVDCQPLSGSVGTYSGYNIGASKEVSEPTHARNIGGHSVWFCWTAPASGVSEFTTAGSSFDTTLGIYHGNDLASLVEDASDNDSAGNKLSHAIFNATAGTTYRIAIDGFSGAWGTYTLRWNQNVQLAIRRLSATQTDLSLTAAPSTYDIFGSDDLKTWTLVTTFTTTSNFYRFTDQSAGAHSNRFYHAAWSP